MLAIDHLKTTRTLTPNILPCSIHHSAPLKIAKRYWSPSTDHASKTSTSYLRGRKLKGRTVKLPPGYEGHILQKTDRAAVVPPSMEPPPMYLERDEMEALNDALSEDDERPEDVKVLEQKGKFDEVVVWGHETVPEDGDEYVKGVEEWIAFAEAIHRDQEPSQETSR